LRDDHHPELALGDKLGNDIGSRYRDFRLECSRNPKPLDQLRHATDREIADRFCVEQRPLERLDRAKAHRGAALPSRQLLEISNDVK
jgi:hypothetical protein